MSSGLGDLGGHSTFDPPLVSGVVAQNPGSDAAGVYVTLPSTGHTQPYGPCVWAQKGAAVPTVGTRCLVGFDQDRTPWMVMWEGATTDPGG